MLGCNAFENANTARQKRRYEAITYDFRSVSGFGSIVKKQLFTLEVKEGVTIKVAIIGAGNVGKAVFHDLQHVNMIREITLTDRNENKVKAQVADAKDAAVLWEEYGAKLNFGG